MKFEPKRSLYFNGEIDTHTSMELILGITKLYATDPKALITLFIISSGGSITDTFAIYEYVTKVLKPNLRTVVLGEASSMAVLLFLMGDTRYIGKLVIMRFHEPWRTLIKDTVLTPKIARRADRELSESKKKYLEILVNRTANKISKSDGTDLLDSDTTISARQAVKLGIAHKVL